MSADGEMKDDCDFEDVKGCIIGCLRRPGLEEEDEPKASLPVGTSSDGRVPYGRVSYKSGRIDAVAAKRTTEQSSCLRVRGDRQMMPPCNAV